MNLSLSDVWVLYASQSERTTFEGAADCVCADFGAIVERVYRQQGVDVDATGGNCQARPNTFQKYPTRRQKKFGTVPKDFRRCNGSWSAACFVVCITRIVAAVQVF